MSQREQQDRIEEDLQAPFARLLSIELVEAQPGWARLRMPIEEKHLQNRGAVQGGLTVALADAAFNAALNTLLERGQIATTVELKVNFIRPAIGRELLAEGKIVHKGRRLVVGEMAVKDQDGKMVATGLGTYAILSSERQADTS